MTANELINLRNREIKCLDHGFVRVVDHMGDDNAIVQAARVSYGHGTKGVREDRGLIRHLMRHRHTTPFEMCEIKFHCMMPMFVARQWIRHRTANVNEYSARYSVVPDVFYIPDVNQLLAQSDTNKQGRDNTKKLANPGRVIAGIEGTCKEAYGMYESLLADGLTRELARMVLPVNVYTQWYWKIDLHNLFHFLSLRLDLHAQYEIRVYAEAMWEFVRQWVPIAAEAFEDYRLEGASLSQQELALFRKWYAERVRADMPVIELMDGVSIREANEFEDLLRGEQDGS